MGYRSIMEGEIKFHPPLVGQELEERPSPAHGLFVIEVVETEVPHPEGTLIRKAADTIKPRWSEEVKAYTVERDLEAVAEMLPGRKFHGSIRIEGEDVGDLRRVSLADGGKVVEEYATLTWPDGTREPYSR